MPLHKIINFNTNTQILVWKVTETYEQLMNEVVLNPNSQIRLQKMKSPVHQGAFLSVRKLLQEAGLTDLDLYYDSFGKPYLKNNQHISISHSHHFSALIISDKAVGIDIELQQKKIIRIADKFVNKEFLFLEPDNQTDYLKKLTLIWGAKEAIFKIQNEKGISFKNHIQLRPFLLQDSVAEATLFWENQVKGFKLFHEEIENFRLVYAFVTSELQ